MADPTSLLAFAAPDFEGGGLAAYAWAFGQGVLVDLTPCVYPLIPITVAVFGAKGVSRGRALFLASAYVLGMAVLYTSLGVAVALSGAAFGAWLGNPWVVYPIVLCDEPSRNSSAEARPPRPDDTGTDGALARAYPGV